MFSKLWENTSLAREKDRIKGPIKHFLLRDYALDANISTPLIARHFRVIQPNLAEIIKALQYLDVVTWRWTCSCSPGAYIFVGKEMVTGGKALVDRLEIRVLKESENWCDITGRLGVCIFATRVWTSVIIDNLNFYHVIYLHIVLGTAWVWK